MPMFHFDVVVLVVQSILLAKRLTNDLRSLMDSARSTDSARRLLLEFLLASHHHTVLRAGGEG